MELSWLAIIIVVCVMGVMMAINILIERYDIIIDMLNEIKNHQNGKKEIPPRA